MPSFADPISGRRIRRSGITAPRWDEKLKGLCKKPLHDWASHAADTFRTAAVVIREPEKGENVNSVWNRPVAGRLRRMSAADNCRAR